MYRNPHMLSADSAREERSERVSCRKYEDNVSPKTISFISHYTTESISGKREEERKEELQSSTRKLYLSCLSSVSGRAGEEVERKIYVAWSNF